MNILWISLRVPYDSVPHAGGKIHNYYLKKLHKRISDIFLVSFFKSDESEKIDLALYNIKNKLICRDLWDNNYALSHKFLSFVYLLLPFFNSLNLLHCRYIKRALCAINELKEKKYSPDVVILQWTEMGALLPRLKKIWPNAKYICIEEDVYFLGAYRRFLAEKSPIKKIINFIDYVRVKHIEKRFVEKADLVILNNFKDQNLLLDNGILANTWIWTPYFQNMRIIDNKHVGKDILFYGAMSRAENYLSAIWFIEKVFNGLEKKGFRFIVVGNNPHESLKKYDNGQSIRIIGFVDDVSPYFENSLCLVAPLLLGAGVKIKVIESMSAGLPVLTNEIGIEGIPAQNEEEYFFCKTPEEYEKRIIELANDTELGRKIGTNAKKFVEKNYNYEKDAEEFCHRVVSLVN